MAQKPGIPKGTRDFTPAQMIRRNYIFDTIRKVFKTYGYQAIETPAMESLHTLLGKYGDEGDKLIFKILNSGDFASKIDSSTASRLSEGSAVPFELSRALTSQISEKALRYDLTVPFARYIVQHRHETTFPFKRYQIQPVWRADRPQKGRYREFYQCDVDVIGSKSLLNEAELLHIICEVFGRLKISIRIKLNNRKILAGIAEIIGQADKIVDITVAIDKLDKIGLDGVNKELARKGLPQESIDQLQPIIHLSGTNSEKLKQLKTVLSESETGMQGIAEMSSVLDFSKEMDISEWIDLDLTLARGLNYYTGAIIEAKSSDIAIGSICGGGRYDDLTGIFGLPDVSGVGVSFGADRIYDVLEQTELFPEDSGSRTQILIVNFGEDELKACIPIAITLRDAGFSVELYPDQVKMKKQMSYANANSIPYVILAGQQELSENSVTVKDMTEGNQSSSLITNIVDHLNNLMND
ncbi:MAG: histidine--tRNA ligase [Bacteroidetes bacterium]|nr:histidine--tRNA ligase [Bacteroidota bacterium]